MLENCSRPWTCRGAGVRRLSVKRVSQKPSSELTPNLMERELFTISLGHFFHFSKFSNNPMGVTISKRYSSHSYGSFSITLLLNIFPVTLLTKVTYWHFGISIFKFLKKIAILVNMGPYGTATYSSSSRFSTQLF